MIISFFRVILMLDSTVRLYGEINVYTWVSLMSDSSCLVVIGVLSYYPHCDAVVLSPNKNSTEEMKWKHEKKIKTSKGFLARLQSHSLMANLLNPP